MDDSRERSASDWEATRRTTAEVFLRQTQMAVCVSDARLPDMPIVFANDAFLRLTGYGLDEVVGRNCRFLQGENTDQLDVDWLRRALDDEDVCVIELLNYRKDGTPFWNALHIGPVFDDDGELLYYFGSQWDITDRVVARDESARSRSVARELQERLRDVLDTVGSIIRVGARSADDPGELVETAAGRVDALARSHRSIMMAPASLDTDLGTMMRTLLEPHDVADRVALAGEKIAIPTRLLAPVGLFVHEIAVGSSGEGALASRGGSVELGWRVEDDTLLLSWCESCEPGRDAPRLVPSETGILDGVLRSVDARIEPFRDDRRACVRLRVPLPTVH